MVKLEYNQSVTFTAGGFTDRRGNPAEIQEGSAVYTVQAQDFDGNDVDLALEVNPDNELEATITSGDVAATGVITFTADGDPSADEEAPIVATASIIVRAPNAVALTLTASDPVDVGGATA